VDGSIGGNERGFDELVGRGEREETPALNDLVHNHRFTVGQNERSNKKNVSERGERERERLHLISSSSAGVQSPSRQLMLILGLANAVCNKRSSPENSHGFNPASMVNTAPSASFFNLRKY
jgi:hypothetical protein